jgi:hypothetical protein
MDAHRPMLHAGICFCLLGFLAPAALAQSPARAPSVEQLQAELERRDAVISDLLQRVQALEQRVGAPAAAPAQPSAPSAPPAARASRTTSEEADEALLERALERSLVLSGGALLPRGVREGEPSIFYDHLQRSGLAILGNGVVSRSFRREDFGAALAFRAGLPWSSQFDISIPYTHQRVEAVVDGVARNSSASGVGDIQVALTHQFLNERTSGFALLGGVSWSHGNRTTALRSLVLGLPDFAAPAAIGAGHDAFGARVTATKRIDPVVFVGSLAHTWNRAETVEGASVRTGAADGANLRAILAVSPDVSLRTGLAFTRTGKTRINGLGIEGTRSTASLLEVGSSIVLDRNRLLDLSLGIGLTSESPDFVFGLSMPIRF